MSDDRAQSTSSSAPPQSPTGAPGPEIVPALAVHFAIATDATTFTLIFSQPAFPVGGPAGPTVARLIPSLAVALTPMLAKDLMKVLQRTITQFEAVTGATIPDIPTTPPPPPPGTPG
jgi:hypothetical protein